MDRQPAALDLPHLALDPGPLAERWRQMRGDPADPPDASLIIPINASADLGKALGTLQDVSRYTGPYRLELIMVINNYPAGSPPAEIEALRRAGARVVAEPDLRSQGRTTIINARLAGIRASQADFSIHFDADCRIAHPDRLIDWYAAQGMAGADLAYTHVDYYELPPDLSIKVRMGVHHVTRRFKREVLGIPTCRGSNYAARNATLIRLYEAGVIIGDIAVGRAIRADGGRIVYSGDPALQVLTSGRKIETGWLPMARYFLWRLKINLGAEAAARRTGAGGGAGR